LLRFASTLLAAGALLTAHLFASARAHVVPVARTGLVARTAVVVPVAPTAVVVRSQQSATLWTAPAALSLCPAGAPARVVFPSDSPSHATGRGAVVWSASSTCPGGEGARVDAIGAGDVPGVAIIPSTATGRPLAPSGPLAASGAPHGKIIIAGANPREADEGLSIQGAARGPFAALHPDAGTADPIALTTAYLGDIALASPPAGGLQRGAVNVHVERFFSHGFTRNVVARAASGGGPLQALTLAMDYRAEALAVWVQHGAIYARLVPSRGAAHPLERLAAVGAHPRIAALLSDDNRAIVAWVEQRGSQTSVFIDRSKPGVRFGSPELLERFNDPDGLSSPAASPSLVRLSSESVVLAWAGSADGHWVVRAAPVDLNGVLGLSTIAAPDADALLADLAPGPDDDALLLWTEPQPTAAGVPDVRREALFAAHGLNTSPGASLFGEPELVAAPAPVSDAAVAFDPASDRAVAVWQGEAARIEYSIRGRVAGP
jgi:hypothetical protein